MKLVYLALFILFLFLVLGRWLVISIIERQKKEKEELKHLDDLND